MPETLIVIVTCPRGGISYFDNTIAALTREGAGDPDCARLVLADGDEGEAWKRAPFYGWDFDVRHPRAGSRVMMWWAFARALEAGVERLIYCEDDITPCRNAVRRMARVPIPDAAAFVTFHDQGAVGGNSMPGLYMMPFSRRMYEGSLCLAFPRRTLMWLAERDPLAPFPQQQQKRGLLCGPDLVLAGLLIGSPWPNYVAHLPRLVRHDGVVSTAHPSKELVGARATIDFPGVDFDALTLR